MEPVFVFSGQGAQYPGMAKDIVEASPAAAAIFEKADSALGWKVSELCFSGPQEKLTESRYCQPAIYTASCACLAAFKDKYPDVKPRANAGLSLGEFAALYSSEVFSFVDGLRLVARRGELMDEACKETAGAMASVLGADIQAVKPVCDEAGIDVANLNCPGQIVISGTKEGVEKAIGILKGNGVKKIIPLKVAGAFHSRLMRSAADRLEPVLDSAPLGEPVYPVAQNFTGKFEDSVSDIRRNLYMQISGSVRWDDCVKTLFSTGADCAVEFGPGNVLTGLIKRINPAAKTFNVGKLDELKTLEGAF